MNPEPELVPLCRNLFKEDLEDLILLLNASNIVSKGVLGPETIRPIIHDYYWTLSVTAKDFPQALEIAKEYAEYLMIRERDPYEIELCDDELAEDEASEGFVPMEPGFMKEMDATLDPEMEHESISICPRCQQKKVIYPDEPVPRFFFLIIPVIIRLLVIRTKGSLRKCTLCNHEWREKP